MPDPLSITTGVVALLTVPVSVVDETRKLQEGASVVHETISALTEDVEGIARVLESLRNTFEAIPAMQGTKGHDHLKSLWNNVARTIEKADLIPGQLASLIQEINGDCRFMGAYMKYIRLKLADGKMNAFRVRVQSVLDEINPCLSLVVVCDQNSHQIKADEAHTTIQSLLEGLYKRMDETQRMILNLRGESKVATVEVLKDSVQSAADTLSSAATIVAARESEHGDEDAMASVFGDCLSGRDNPAVKQWIESVTVSAFEEASALSRRTKSTTDLTNLNKEVPGDMNHGPISEGEITLRLLADGTQKLLLGDIEGAEQKLRDCLGRINTDEISTDSRLLQTYLDATHQLYGKLYRKQQWLAAQEVLLQKLEIRKRSKGDEGSGFCADILSLAKLLANQDDVAAAQQHAKQALHGFKELQSTNNVRACLHLLIALCEQDANESNLQEHCTMLDELSDTQEKLSHPRTHSPFVNQECRYRDAQPSRYYHDTCNEKTTDLMVEPSTAQEPNRNSASINEISANAQNSGPGVPWADVWSRKYKISDGDERRRSALPAFVHNLVGLARNPVISEPKDMVHVTHVEFNPVSGEMEVSNTIALMRILRCCILLHD